MNVESLFSADSDQQKPSAIRRLSRLINDPAIISFAGGVPSPRTFPVEALAEIAAQVIRDQAEVALQYGPTPGLAPLREAVAEICRGRGLEGGAERILITTGSQQAINLVAQALLDPDDVVLVELPTYIGGLSSLYGRRAAIVGVEQDEDGAVPDSLDATVQRLHREGRRVKMFYTIPNFQNPSGRLMTQERRGRVMEIARKWDLVVVEDDPYGELVYTDADTTPIAARDEDGRVVYLGSFSKVLSPGLRCGWIQADEALLRRFELAKEAADLCSGMLDQSIVLRFLQSGRMPEQLTSIRDFYRSRRATLLDALRTALCLPGELDRWGRRTLHLPHRRGGLRHGDVDR